MVCTTLMAYHCNTSVAMARATRCCDCRRAEAGEGRERGVPRLAARDREQVGHQEPVHRARGQPAGQGQHGRGDEAPARGGAHCRAARAVRARKVVSEVGCELCASAELAVELDAQWLSEGNVKSSIRSTVREQVINVAGACRRRHAERDRLSSYRSAKIITVLLRNRRARRPWLKDKHKQRAQQTMSSSTCVSS